jgi:hypothetical protein
MSLLGDIAGPIGGVAGAGISALGGKNAAKAQERSTAAALDFAKAQEAKREQYYNQANDTWRQQYNADQARKDALLARYGFSAPSASLAMPSAGSGVSIPPGAVPIGGRPPVSNMRVSAAPSVAGAIQRPDMGEMAPPDLNSAFEFPGARYGLVR